MTDTKEIVMSVCSNCNSCAQSPAGCIPSPFAVMYASTKALLTEFAVSIAPEVRSQGVDVIVVHPSVSHFLLSMVSSLFCFD